MGDVMKHKRKIDYPCSSCGAKPGEHCRSSSGKKTDVHSSRYQQWDADRRQRQSEREEARKKEEQAFFDKWPEGIRDKDWDWTRYVEDGVSTWVSHASCYLFYVTDTGQAWRWEVRVNGRYTDTCRDRIIDAGYVTTTLSDAKAAAWAIVGDEDEDEDEDKPRPSTEGW